MESSTALYARRLAEIRGIMKEEGIDGFIVPCTDQFQVEYLGPDVHRLKWLTGFSGEAAVAVVLADRAAIFVDGRFTVQVREQVPETLFDYCHLHQEPHLQWLAEHLNSEGALGFDASLQTYDWYQDACKVFESDNIHLKPLAENPIDRLWHDRPLAPAAPGFLLGEEYTGSSCLEKRQRLSEIMTKDGVDSLVLTQPDSVNWLFNIRGSDVPSLPVVLGYGLVHQDGAAELFVPDNKLDYSFEVHAGEGVSLKPLNQLENRLTQLGEQGALVQVDTRRSNAWTPLTLTHSGARLHVAEDPCMLMKAIKNDTEIAGMRKAHIYAGIATCRFFAWLDRVLVDQSDTLDEGVLADKLEALLAENPQYHGYSFETISALGPNGAMCHYNHTQTIPRKLGQDGLYLVDSGAQYPEGTTDMTRTVQVGPVSDEMRTRYTQVLQGHIQLATARFPEGTHGVQLDVLARMPLWQDGCNYDHGTGHGVGHFLSVHESPAGIGSKVMESKLLPGMMITDEPGYYKADSYGIRIENLYLIKPVLQGEGFLELESLTFVPIDCRLIDKKRLSPEQIQWVDDYHQQVRDQIAPYLDDVDRLWLEKVTRPLSEQ